MSLADYDYPLPPELVAQTPAARREASRLLLVPPAGGFAHHVFSDLPALLPKNPLLVLNDTRVLPARLRARKPTGGRVEILLVRPGPEGIWSCLVRGGLERGTRLTLEGPADGAPEVTYLGRTADGEAQVQLRGGDLDWMLRFGEMPLPPYIERPVAAEDAERYQTVYASRPGAVAAPTAGLHFTQEMIARFEHVNVTLHVGPGTFAPVRGDDLDAHVMHVEHYQVPEATAAAWKAARAAGRPIVAVGTTVVRTLESALDPATNTLRPGYGVTQLFIRPPYQVRTFDLLITNFHMPRSTLLMLVSAFAGRERILAAYGEAVAQRYRFFSYGDAMLLHPKEP